jgi:hypothetical protein
MMIHFLRKLMVRDLEALRAELRAYPDERSVWECPSGISNSAGTLTLHLIGNLRHYVGANLGGTKYVRDRDAEFAGRDVSLAVLEAEIAEAIAEVNRALGGFDVSLLDKEYAPEVAGVRLPTELFLLHLATHLAYHLGQIDYHRRVVTGHPSVVGAQSITALRDP